MQQTGYRASIQFSRRRLLEYAGASSATLLLPAFARAQTDWGQLVDAAKKEGTVVWSAFSASTQAVATGNRFQEKYGISVNMVPLLPGSFRARWTAERNAGKASIDLRFAGLDDNRFIAGSKWDQPWGPLPELDAPASIWLKDPLGDVKAGNGNTLFWGVTPYSVLANNKLVPPEMGPTSYKDLADPKFKGQILLVDPLAAGPGARFAVLGYLAYGADYIRAVLANTKALTTRTIDAPAQIARGEYGIFVHASAEILTGIYELPEPRPLRLVRTEDGQIITGACLSLMQEAPHPNAARLFANFLLSREAQKILADLPGGQVIRTDVTPKIAEPLALTGKNFPGSPESFEFSTSLLQTMPKAVIEPLIQEAGFR